MSTKKKPTAFARLCASINTIAQRLIDGGELTARRLATIEDRLAMLDGGDDAKAAARDALFNVNADRVSAGRDFLAMKIDDATGRAVWKK